MKARLKKIFVAVLTLAIIMTNLVFNTEKVLAAGAATGIVSAGKMENEELVLVPGETKRMRVPVKAIGDAMTEAVVTVSSSSKNFSLSQATLALPDQSPVLYLSNYGVTYVDFDVIVKETAKIGPDTITIKVTARDSTSEGNRTYSHTMDIDVQVSRELTPAQIVMSDVTVKNSIIGGNSEVSFAIKNEGEITARNTYYSIDYGTTLIAPNYGTAKIKLGDLQPGMSQYITLPIEILSTATVGLKTITAKFEYKDSDGAPGTDAHQIYVDVKKNEKAPELQIEDVSYEGELKPGAKITVKAVIRNYGETKADNITVKVDDTTTSSEGFLKNYFTDSIYVGGVKADGKIEALIPLTVSKQATNGNKKVNFILGYEDADGNKYSATISIYPEIIGGSSSEGSGLIVKNVKQNPAQPVAGDKMQVSFDLENKSQADIADIKISLQGLDGNTFIPNESEPYKFIDKIQVGKSKTITIPLTLADNIPEGLNNLMVKLSYAGSTAADPITIPIKDVRNELGSGSKPKIIISNYASSTEELRAGTSFDFTFDLHNTHSSVAAKNITVTITQADNVFSVAQGSNSFFVNKIDAGETVQHTIKLKVKADATTKAYPLKIAIEYEYEGIKPNPETGEVGVIRTEELNLQAIENSRPVVDYVNVYSWDGNVIVGNPASLNFEFYNMGKSALNNVITKVEGDFTKADGNMHFLGNVAAGTSGYADFEVIPNVEGTAKGLLRITFEDSNGEEIEITKEFETEVMSATVFDPGAMEGGDMGVFNPGGAMAKKAIVPVWLFIIIQIVIVAVFIPITRKGIIGIYKAKLRKKEQEQY